MPNYFNNVEYDDDVYFGDEEEEIIFTFGDSPTLDEVDFKKLAKKKITDSIRAKMLGGIKKSHSLKSWIETVGYPIQDLRVHLESQFEDGMNWGNRGIGYGYWHIDHIVPIGMFDYQSYEDLSFRQCWYLTNLRPLWRADNISRRKKVPIYKVCNTEPYMSAMNCDNIKCDDCCFGKFRKEPKW